jgi:hypothetical protein
MAARTPPQTSNHSHTHRHTTHIHTSPLPIHFSCLVHTWYYALFSLLFFFLSLSPSLNNNKFYLKYEVVERNVCVCVCVCVNDPFVLSSVPPVFYSLYFWGVGGVCDTYLHMHTHTTHTPFTRSLSRILIFGCSLASSLLFPQKISLSHTSLPALVCVCVCMCVHVCLA